MVSLDCKFISQFHTNKYPEQISETFVLISAEARVISFNLGSIMPEKLDSNMGDINKILSKQ